MTSRTAGAIVLLTLFSSPHASADEQEGITALQMEIEALQTEFANRISVLEAKLARLQGLPEPAAGAPLQPSKDTTPIITNKSAQEDPIQSASLTAPVAPATSGRRIFGNEFNPSVGIILNGAYRDYSSEMSEMAGFPIGHEGERGKEGFSVDHSELNFAANIDDKFSSKVTVAIAEHEGETEVELEEAFIQTLAGAGLPDGMSVMFGRGFWTLGYLNEHHNHADDFADRPLTNRVFLNNTFNDDGLEVTYILPADFYAEIGGGLFLGDDYPFGGADGGGVGAWSLFARTGGDIGYNHSWRLGAYLLSGSADNGRSSNDDDIFFVGDSDLYVADIRYTWAPTGNPRQKELTFQSEFFLNQEDGTYEDSALASGLVMFDEQSSGWYAQGVYKFNPNWRLGLRYSRLAPADTPAALFGGALDAADHDPQALAIMADWTNSEFSRLRLQYSLEELSDGQEDNQFTLQYIMSLGAHGAHKY